MNIEYTVLKSKEVVNILDGKRLGRIIDLLIDSESGRIKGIIVPGEKGISFFKSCDDIYIPWKNIKRIGDDVILVEIPIDVKVCSAKSAENASTEEKEED